MKTKNSESDYTKRSEVKTYNWKHTTAAILVIILFVVLLTKFDINFNYDAY